MPKSRNNEVRIDDSANTLPRQLIRKKQSSNFRCYATELETRLPNDSEAVFSACSVQSCYKEDFRGWQE
jgi:hypothetical protein